MTQPLNQNQKQVKPVRFFLENGVYTHTMTYSALYSIKRNKFVNARCHKGSRWGCDYLLYPGTYVLFDISGYRDERGLEFVIKKVKIEDDGNGYGMVSDVENIVDTEVTLDELLKMIEDPNVPQALRLFIQAIPTVYHTVGNVPDPTVTFSDDEIKKVKEYLEAYVRSKAEE